MKKVLSLVSGFLFLLFVSMAINPGVKEDKIKEIKIGDQIWMAENLKVTHFRNGDPVPIIKSKKKWFEARENEQAASCHYNNDEDYSLANGLLYNWYAATDERGLAPEGWRIPTEEDWNILINHLGGWKNAGKLLKSTSGWNEFEGKMGNGNNISGFTATPCSMRGHKGEYYDREGQSASWWMMDEQNQYVAWSRTVTYKKDQSISFNYQKGNGISIRCIKDL